MTQLNNATGGTTVTLAWGEEMGHGCLNGHTSSWEREKKEEAAEDKKKESEQTKRHR